MRLSQSHYCCRPTANDVYFNACLPKSSDAKLDFELDNYTLMAHEVGHALGLSNAAAPLYYLLNINNPQNDDISHPTIPDSIMSKGEDSTIGEARCAPHPFDVMAIYALYQSED